MENFFKSFDIKVYIIKRAKDSETIEILSSSANVDKDYIKEMTILTVENTHSMFEKLIPMMKPYSHYFYWKYDQYELMSRVALLVNNKAHLTLYGFKTIISIIYSYDNNRTYSKEFWIEVMENWFKSQQAENKSGEYMIHAV